MPRRLALQGSLYIGGGAAGFRNRRYTQFPQPTVGGGLFQRIGMVGQQGQKADPVSAKGDRRGRLAESLCHIRSFLVLVAGSGAEQERVSAALARTRHGGQALKQPQVQNGRASCRERVCKYVLISVVSVTL